MDLNKLVLITLVSLFFFTIPYAHAETYGAFTVNWKPLYIGITHQKYLLYLKYNRPGCVYARRPILVIKSANFMRAPTVKLYEVNRLVKVPINITIPDYVKNITYYYGDNPFGIQNPYQLNSSRYIEYYDYLPDNTYTLVVVNSTLHNCYDNGDNRTFNCTAYVSKIVQSYKYVPQTRLLWYCRLILKTHYAYGETGNLFLYNPGSLMICSGGKYYEIEIDYPYHVTNKAISLTADIGLVINGHLYHPWFNTTWFYRMPIYINNTPRVVKLKIPYIPGMLGNFSDLRFTYYNPITQNETELPYWISYYKPYNYSIVYVKVYPYASPGQNITLYAYFDNPTAPPASNFTNTINRTYEYSNQSYERYNFIYYNSTNYFFIRMINSSSSIQACIGNDFENATWCSKNYSTYVIVSKSGNTNSTYLGGISFANNKDKTIISAGYFCGYNLKAAAMNCILTISDFNYTNMSFIIPLNNSQYYGYILSDAAYDNKTNDLILIGFRQTTTTGAFNGGFIIRYNVSNESYEVYNTSKDYYISISKKPIYGTNNTYDVLYYLKGTLYLSKYLINSTNVQILNETPVCVAPLFYVGDMYCNSNTTICYVYNGTSIYEYNASSLAKINEYDLNTSNISNYFIGGYNLLPDPYLAWHPLTIKKFGQLFYINIIRDNSNIWFNNTYLITPDFKTYVKGLEEPSIITPGVFKLMDQSPYGMNSYYFCTANGTGSVRGSIIGFHDGNYTYKYGAATPIDAPPNVTILFPYPNAYTNQNIIQVIATDDNNQTLNLSIYLNGTLIYNNDSYINNTIITVNYTAPQNITPYVVYATASDGQLTGYSDYIYFHYAPFLFYTFKKYSFTNTYQIINVSTTLQNTTNAYVELWHVYALTTSAKVNYTMNLTNFSNGFYNFSAIIPCGWNASIVNFYTYITNGTNTFREGPFSYLCKGLPLLLPYSTTAAAIPPLSGGGGIYSPEPVFRVKSFATNVKKGKCFMNYLTIELGNSWKNYTAFINITYNKTAVKFLYNKTHYLTPGTNYIPIIICANQPGGYQGNVYITIPLENKMLTGQIYVNVESENMNYQLPFLFLPGVKFIIHIAHEIANIIINLAKQI